MGVTLVSGHSDIDVVGRPERLRRVYEERWDRSGRDDVQRLVMQVRNYARPGVRRCEGAVMQGGGGFTLIELMIVMALIVVLASIGLAVHANSQTRAREAVLKEDLFRMRDAIDQYYADKNAYPPTLEDLVSQKYLRAIPEDPFTRSSSTWRTIMSDIDPANPSATPGVFDV